MPLVLYAQPRDTTKIIADTNKKIVNVDTLMKKLQKKDSGEELVKQITEINRRNRIRSQQENLRNSIYNELDNIRNYFKQGVDTAGLNKQLAKLETGYNVAADGILTNPMNPQIVRNLTASRLLMKDLLGEVEKNLTRVEKYLKELKVYKNRLDSLSQDTTLYVVPDDTVAIADYLKHIGELNKAAGPVDSELRVAISKMLGLQGNLYELRNRLFYGVNYIEGEQVRLTGDLLSNELPLTGEFNLDDVKEGAAFSYLKNKLLVIFFISNHRIVITIYAVLAIMLSLYGVFIMTRLKRREEFRRYAGLAAGKSPMLVSVFIFSIIFQFLFANPPVVIKGAGFLISAILLAFIIFSEIDRARFAYYIVLIFLCILAFTSDLVLGVVEPGRYLMMFLCLVGIAAGVTYIRKFPPKRRRDKIQKIIIGAAVGFLFLSLCFNLTGRYNIAKIFLTSAHYMVLSGVLLYWCYILVCEVIVISRKHFEKGTRYSEITSKRTFMFKLVASLAVIAWVIFFLRNFYLYLYISDSIEFLIVKKRNIGKFDFSFEGVLIFISVIVLSVLISKAIAFFADTGFAGKKSSTRLSNWLLLIRIAVMTAGIMLALAATGIPIDRLTIIIGSLGVGIGFGLQTTINNLFSGILLAFERPFQIGDQIEIGTKMGIIKEIGIRSSKIETFDGSIAIIPNGDLLNQHVINWTKSNDRRRVEVKIGVQFGTDLNNCKQILQKVLDENAEIDKQGGTSVRLDQFGDFGIEFKLSFWVTIYRAEDVKSDIILAVETEFKKEGIQFTINYRV